jgi:uncharacterized protein (DUF58 family)
MGLSVSALNRYIPKFLRRVSATRTRPIVLSQQRIFILPTRYGVIFALLLFVMLVGSTNYSNSLGFLLTFLLASLGMISILHAYRNLARLTVHAGKAQAVFCGQQARYVLQVDNQHKQNRYAIMFHLVQQTPVMIDVMGFSTANIELTQPTTRRGWLPISTVTIATRYPLGLVQAWSHLNLMTTCLVYPCPHPAPTKGITSRLTRPAVMIFSVFAIIIPAIHHAMSTGRPLHAARIC